ncbi:hypothetical protein ACJMK2_019009 [Sinanodonta woodiana]|uniref:G-protein coupled receptors family 1 profile domain-containing protein n=1 Tax=Sinanodonta woodiana TaxID=1069815 RepID=A0ABD3UF76_SINWO
MNDTATFGKSQEEYTEYKAAIVIWMYCSPILIVIGTVGNILSIVVLVRRSLRSSTTMYYLTVLAGSDLCALYFGLLRLWVEFTFKIPIRNLSDVICKVHTFIVYVVTDFTVWILVAVTFDRCLSVTVPFKAKRLCTRRSSRLVIVVIALCLILFNSHFFWTLGLTDNKGIPVCDSLPHAIDFMNWVWPWMDFCVFSLIPFAVMIICNIIIICNMIQSKRKLRQNLGIQLNNISEQEPQKQKSLQETTRQQSFRPRTTSSLTVMLLTVNCVFLLTTSPVVAHLVADKYWVNADESVLAKISLSWTIVNMLQYMNNAIHFFLYCLTGPKFRQELKILFKRRNIISGAEQSAALVDKSVF